MDSRSENGDEQLKNCDVTAYLQKVSSIGLRTNSNEPEDNSSDSFSSIVPQEKYSGFTKKYAVPRDETGKQIRPSEFFLCLYAVLLFCGGAITCGVSLWTMLSGLSYRAFVGKIMPIDASNFSLCGGLISVPCSWIAWISKDNRKNYVLLPVSVLLLLFSLGALSASVTLGVITRSKMVFNGNTFPPKLGINTYAVALNESMVLALTKYEQFPHGRSWDRLQTRMRCCGVDGANDWKKYGKIIPTSCYDTKTQLFEIGCIDLVAYDLGSKTCLNAGFSSILIGLQFTAMLFASFLYIKEHLKLSNNVRQING